MIILESKVNYNEYYLMEIKFLDRIYYEMHIKNYFKKDVTYLGKNKAKALSEFKSTITNDLTESIVKLQNKGE